MDKGGMDQGRTESVLEARASHFLKRPCQSNITFGPSLKTKGIQKYFFKKSSSNLMKHVCKNQIFFLNKMKYISTRVIIAN